MWAHARPLQMYACKLHVHIANVLQVCIPWFQCSHNVGWSENFTSCAWHIENQSYNSRSYQPDVLAQPQRCNCGGGQICWNPSREKSVARFVIWPFQVWYMYACVHCFIAISKDSAHIQILNATVLFQIHTCWGTTHGAPWSLQVPNGKGNGPVECGTEAWGPGQSCMCRLFWHWGADEQQHHLLQSVLRRQRF